MTKVFSMSSDRVYMDDEGTTVFDTNAYPVAFYPSSEQIEITGQTITFPDLIKGDAYAWSVGLIGGGGPYVGCASYITIGPQEWGPNVVGELPPTNELTETVIGTVPSGTDVLLVYVKLTRTSVPSQINGNTIPVLPKEGDYVYCPGGSLALEYLAPLSRSIDVVLDGTNVVLRRRQSVLLTNYSFYRSDNSPTVTGWTHGSQTGSPGTTGHPVFHLQSIGPNFDPSGTNLRRGSGCSLTDTSDFGSEYSADFIIIPGKSNIEPTGGEFEDAVTLQYLGTFWSGAVNTSSYTFPSAPLGIEQATRRIIVALKGGKGHSGSAGSITGLTIAGITATSIVNQHYDTGTAASSWNAAIFIADVPTGVTGDIVATFSQAMHSIEIDVYAAYNLASAAADDTGSTTGFGVNVGLDTVDGGVAVAALWALNGDISSGIDNIAGTTRNVSSPAIHNVNAERAFQSTTGASLTIAITGSSNGRAFVAASFH